MPFNIIRKIKSLPSLPRRRKIAQKFKEELDSYAYLFDWPVESKREKNCALLLRLVDYLLIVNDLHEDERGNHKVWYWANDLNREFPMTY